MKKIFIIILFCSTFTQANLYGKDGDLYFGKKMNAATKILCELVCAPSVSKNSKETKINLNPKDENKNNNQGVNQNSIPSESKQKKQNNQGPTSDNKIDSNREGLSSSSVGSNKPTFNNDKGRQNDTLNQQTKQMPTTTSSNLNNPVKTSETSTYGGNLIREQNLFNNELIKSQAKKRIEATREFASNLINTIRNKKNLTVNNIEDLLSNTFPSFTESDKKELAKIILSKEKEIKDEEEAETDREKRFSYELGRNITRYKTTYEPTLKIAKDIGLEALRKAKETLISIIIEEIEKRLQKMEEGSLALGATTSSTAPKDKEVKKIALTIAKSTARKNKLIEQALKDTSVRAINIVGQIIEAENIIKQLNEPKITRLSKAKKIATEAIEEIEEGISGFVKHLNKLGQCAKLTEKAIETEIKLREETEQSKIIQQKNEAKIRIEELIQEMRATIKAALEAINKGKSKQEAIKEAIKEAKKEDTENNPLVAIFEAGVKADIEADKKKQEKIAAEGEKIAAEGEKIAAAAAEAKIATATAAAAAAKKTQLTVVTKNVQETSAIPEGQISDSQIARNKRIEDYTTDLLKYGDLNLIERETVKDSAEVIIDEEDEIKEIERECLEIQEKAKITEKKQLEIIKELLDEALTIANRALEKIKAAEFSKLIAIVNKQKANFEQAKEDFKESKTNKMLSESFKKRAKIKIENAKQLLEIEEQIQNIIIEKNKIEANSQVQNLHEKQDIISLLDNEIKLLDEKSEIIIKISEITGQIIVTETQINIEEEEKERLIQAGEKELLQKEMQQLEAEIQKLKDKAQQLKAEVQRWEESKKFLENIIISVKNSSDEAKNDLYNVSESEKLLQDRFSLKEEQVAISIEMLSKVEKEKEAAENLVFEANQLREITGKSKVVQLANKALALANNAYDKQSDALFALIELKEKEEELIANINQEVAEDEKTKIQKEITIGKRELIEKDEEAIKAIKEVQQAIKEVQQAINEANQAREEEEEVSITRAIAAVAETSSATVIIEEQKEQEQEQEQEENELTIGLNQQNRIINYASLYDDNDYPVLLTRTTAAAAVAGTTAAAAVAGTSSATVIEIIVESESKTIDDVNKFISSPEYVDSPIGSPIDSQQKITEERIVESESKKIDEVNKVISSLGYVDSQQTIAEGKNNNSQGEGKNEDKIDDLGGNIEEFTEAYVPGGNSKEKEKEKENEAIMQKLEEEEAKENEAIMQKLEEEAKENEENEEIRQQLKAVDEKIKEFSISKIISERLSIAETINNEQNMKERNKTIKSLFPKDKSKAENLKQFVDILKAEEKRKLTKKAQEIKVTYGQEKSEAERRAELTKETAEGMARESASFKIMCRIFSLSEESNEIAQKLMKSLDITANTAAKIEEEIAKAQILKEEQKVKANKKVSQEIIEKATEAETAIDKQIIALHKKLEVALKIQETQGAITMAEAEIKAGRETAKEASDIKEKLEKIKKKLEEKQAIATKEADEATKKADEAIKANIAINKANEEIAQTQVGESSNKNRNKKKR